MDWFSRYWEDIKGNVKYRLLLLVGSAVMAIALALTRGLAVWQQVSLAFLFMLMFGWAITASVMAARSSEPSSPKSVLSASSLIERGFLMQLWYRCDTLLSTYRRLDYDDRQATRYPFNSSSWPEFGKQWSHTAVLLYSLARETHALLAEVSEAARMLGYSDVLIPEANEHTMMPDFLGRMDELTRELKARISKPPYTSNSPTVHT